MLLHKLELLWMQYVVQCAVYCILYRYWEKSVMVCCCCLQPDMAIGCPYGGEDQQGLVLIYNGHAGGLMDIPTQTLSGQWASSSFPASFGFALRGNKDLDQNGYPGTTTTTRPLSASCMTSSLNSPLLQIWSSVRLGSIRQCCTGTIASLTVFRQWIECPFVFILQCCVCVEPGLGQ